MVNSQAETGEGLAVLAAFDKGVPFVVTPNAGNVWLLAWRISTDAAFFSTDFGKKDLDNLDATLATSEVTSAIFEAQLKVRAAHGIPNGAEIDDAALPVSQFTAPALCDWRIPTLYMPEGDTSAVIYRAFRPRVEGAGIHMEHFAATVAERLRLRFDNVAPRMFPAPPGFTFADSSIHIAPLKTSSFGNFALGLSDQIQAFGVGLTVAAGAALLAVSAPVWLPAARSALKR